MKLKKLLCCLFVVSTVVAHTQNLDRPKLVVGIVVDQMRWDYLYRYFDRYAATGGFKRLLKGGFSCENNMIAYTPTITACGHASIYTGSVPAINGIAGNAWEDRQTGATVYCVEDKSVKTVGSNSTAGLMSPRNLLTTTICDELRLATNFRSKVIGVALKDRGSILPAGHSANAAYWYDSQTGNWITSSYYRNDLPKWATDFQCQKLVDTYYNQDWNTTYPINTYLQSTEDNKPYESKALGSGFPYNLKQYSGKNYSAIAGTPYGNSLTAEFAKAAIAGENLGSGSSTDFLAISFSSTDYVGHAFGPNSIEEEDTFLRLDKDLGNLLDFLDAKIGKNQYLLFLSADHGAAHVPGFLKEHNIPAGNLNLNIVDTLNGLLTKKFGKDKLVTDFDNYQLYLNTPLITSANLHEEDVKDYIIQTVTTLPGVDRAFDLKEIREAALNSRIQEMIINGYYPKRSGDIQLLLTPQWIEGFASGGTTHGVWEPYDAHIPLLWFGWNIKAGKLNRETSIIDIAPTVAALLRIQMPSGTVGKPIPEVEK